MNWNDMDEIPYRASQVCRVLGNPKTYQILKILIGEGPFTPTDLAKKLDRSIATICRHISASRVSGVIGTFLQLRETDRIFERVELFARHDHDADP